MKLITNSDVPLHNSSELWNLFLRVPLGNCFWCYFRQLFISLAFRKWTKDCKIPKIVLVQGFCPLKLLDFLSRSVSNPSSCIQILCLLFTNPCKDGNSFALAAFFMRFFFHILRKRLARHIAPLVARELRDPATAAWVFRYPIMWQ